MSDVMADASGADRWKRTEAGHANRPQPPGSHRSESQGSIVIELALGDLRGCFSPRTMKEDHTHAKVLAGTYASLPPILVHRRSMKVIDGSHRVLAAQILSLRSVRAVMFDGTEEEAFAESVRCNVTHGKPLSLAEREQAAITLLRTHREWSDRRIAQVCGLSDKTVARTRHRATAELAQSNDRLGRDGRRRPLDPGALRQRIVEHMTLHPKASDRQTAAAVGASPATVRDVRKRLSEGESPLPASMRPDTCASPLPALDRPETSLSEDRALSSTDEGSDFLQWFESRNIGEGESDCFTGAIPLSRVYLVAQEARRRAACWARFAEDLEARTQSRHSPPNSR